MQLRKSVSLPSLSVGGKNSTLLPLDPPPQHKQAEANVPAIVVHGVKQESGKYTQTKFGSVLRSHDASLEGLPRNISLAYYCCVQKKVVADGKDQLERHYFGHGDYIFFSVDGQETKGLVLCLERRDGIPIEFYSFPRKRMFQKRFLWKILFVCAETNRLLTRLKQRKRSKSTLIALLGTCPVQVECF